jgi:phosphomannomutase
MAYYAIATQPCDGGLVVTASHNPGRYNGMKLCRQGARPISGDTGIATIERMCAQAAPPPASRRGTVQELDLLGAYADHVARFCDLASEGRPGRREIVLAIDAANGMAGYTLPAILERLQGVEAHTLFMEPDGTFPNHEANPLKEENLVDLKRLVGEVRADVGVAFDGDADRCCFVDNAGETVSADLMTALLARHFLRRRGPAPILYDLRSSWVVKEEVAKAGGTPVRDRVGHSFMKATMREKGAIFGGELSGHFYFADNFMTDSGVIAMISALNVIAASGGASLRDLVSDLRRYHATGEINFRVADKEATLARLRKTFASGKQDELDGITVEYGSIEDPDWWWFNVRPSNTEPLLRLNLEARSAAVRDRRRAELIALLGEPV